MSGTSKTAKGGSSNPRPLNANQPTAAATPKANSTHTAIQLVRRSEFSFSCQPQDRARSRRSLHAARPPRPLVTPHSPLSNSTQLSPPLYMFLSLSEFAVIHTKSLSVLVSMHMYARVILDRHASSRSRQLAIARDRKTERIQIDDSRAIVKELRLN